MFSCERQQIMPDLHVKMEDQKDASSAQSSDPSESAAERLLKQISFTSPLPLQCLAAEALPEAIKEEIKQVTQYSIREQSRTSSSSSSETSIITGTHGQRVQQLSDPVATSTTESGSKLEHTHTVTVPLQFFTNGCGLRIVGGIYCQHSGEKHAQIHTLKQLEDSSDSSSSSSRSSDMKQEVFQSFHKGFCIVEMEGQSLKNASFEDVRKMMKSISSPLVKLVVRDCRALSNHSTVATTTIGSRPLLSMGKVEEEPTHFLTLRRQRKAAAAAKAVEESSNSNRRDELVKASSALEVSIEFALDTDETNNRNRLFAKTSSSQSLDSVVSETTETIINGSETGMVKISLRHLKPHGGVVCINLHKLKLSSKNSLSDPSSVFLNTYIFPDTKSQGVQSCRMVSSTASTDSLMENCARYNLSEEELEGTSLRILVWESNSSIRSKKAHFRGEVFLSLGANNSLINMQGVSRWYTISLPDKNLPSLPPPHHVSNQGTLMKKMKASLATTTQTFGTLTLKKSKKNNLGGSLSRSLQDISPQQRKTSQQQLQERVTNLPSILEPLKEKKRNAKLSLQEQQHRQRSNRRNSVFELLRPEALEATDGEIEKVPSTPNLVPMVGEEPPSPGLGRNVSLIEFLDGLNTPRTRNKLEKLSKSLLKKRSFSQGVLESSSESNNHSVSLHSFDGRPKSILSQTESDLSQDSILSSSSEASSSIGSVNSKPNHIRAWSEDATSLFDSTSETRLSLAKSFSQSVLGTTDEIVRHYSFLGNSTEEMNFDSPTDSPPLSFPAKQSSTPAKTDDGYDRLLPLVQINDGAVHRPRSLFSSTETLTPQASESPTDTTHVRSSSFGERVSSPDRTGSLRHSKSMGEISLLEEEREKEQSDGFSSEQQQPLRTPLESSLPDTDATSLDRSPQRSRGKHDRSTLEEFLFSLKGSSSEGSSCSSADNSPKGIRKRSVSMDVLKSSKKDAANSSVMPALFAMRKDSKVGSIKRLLDVYSSGKPVGSVNMQLIARHVARSISVEILDVLFYSPKLMNADYTVKVNLFNRFNEKCEVSKKGVAVFRKNGMHEQKQFPPVFEFCGDPSVYYIQVQFHVKNRMFGRKFYQVFQDLDSINRDTCNNEWFELRTL